VVGGAVEQEEVAGAEVDRGVGRVVEGLGAVVLGEVEF